MHAVGDAVVHRAALLRVGVQQQRDGRVVPRMVIKSFDPAFGAVENDFRHCSLVLLYGAAIKSEYS